MSDNGNPVLAEKLRELCRKHHGVWHEKSLLELIQSHADAQTAELRSQLSECQREREELIEKLHLERDEDEPDDFLYPAEPEPQGPYSFVQCVLNYFDMVNRVCDRTERRASAAEQQLQQMKAALRTLPMELRCKTCGLQATGLVGDKCYCGAETEPVNAAARALLSGKGE